MTGGGCGVAVLRALALVARDPAAVRRRDGRYQRP